MALRRTAMTVVAVCVALVSTGCSRAGTAADSVDDVTIGILRAVATGDDAQAAFRAELRTAGFIEGRNLTVIPDNDVVYPDPADAEAAAAQWEADGVDLILALSSTGAAAAAAGAPNTDVLFLSNDPTATGLVRDERRPEGRLTGATFRVPADRTLSLAQRIIPGLETIGIPYPPDDPAAVAHRDAVMDTAEQLGLRVVTAEFTDAQDVPAAVQRLADDGVDAILASNSPAAIRVLPETGEAVQRHRLAAIANTHLAEFALISLYPDADEIQRQLARQAVRLLSGNPPSAVPVEDPRRFLTRLDEGVADGLGLELPDDVKREADIVVSP